MKTCYVCATILPFAAIAALSATALSLQDKGKPPAKEDPMMAKMMAYAMPGEAHKVLEAKEGKWSLTVKMFPAAGAPAQESKGTNEVKWVLDHRFLEDRTEGAMGDMPFHGLGYVGYDNLKKRYVGSWMDNMSTGIMVSEGTYDAATKTFTYGCDMPDVMQGKYVRSRSVEKMIDKDHWTMQTFGPGADGKEFMSMQIEYTRIPAK